MTRYPPPQNNTLAILLALAAFALGWLLGAGEVPAVLKRQPETPPSVQREPAGAGEVPAVP